MGAIHPIGVDEVPDGLGIVMIAPILLLVAVCTEAALGFLFIQTIEDAVVIRVVGFLEAPTTVTQSILVVTILFVIISICWKGLKKWEAEYISKNREVTKLRNVSSFESILIRRGVS